MYNFNNCQYVFKQSSGKVWNFFFEDRVGLCYSVLTKKNIWSEPVCLQKKAHRSFYADLDFDDNFHILYQDIQGNIFYTQVTSTGIKSIPVLNSKTPTFYNKHLLLIPQKNTTHFFYVIQHNDTRMLAHQTLSDGTLSTPKVIDYVPQNDHPYSAVCDRTGSLFVFYQLSDSKHLQIGYKKYVPGQRYWSEFTPITQYSGNSEFPRAIIDQNNIIHICYQRYADRKLEFIYQQKIPDKNIWTPEQVIHGSQNSFENSSIACINDSIYTYWVREDSIFFSSSKDGGLTWSKPARYSFSVGKQLVCIKYRTNSPYESDKIALDDLPGCFIGGYKLAFYQDSTINMSNLSAEELRDLIVEGLKLLKSSVEDLKEVQGKTNEEISRLNREQDRLDKEITKFSVKVSFLEGELNQFKQMNHRLESYEKFFEDPGKQTKAKTAETEDLKGWLTTEISNHEKLSKFEESIHTLQEELHGLKQYMAKKLP